MKFFAVYIKPKAAEPLETALFVKEGFSILAMMLNIFWMLYHRIWVAAALLIAFNIALSYGQFYNVISAPAVFILNTGLLVFIGFEASDWYQQTLKRHGYLLLDIVSGKDLEQAQQRFFDNYIHQADSLKK